MSLLDEPVDMEISDGEEPMSDMEVSDSDIDPPPQGAYNLADVTAQSRATTDPSQFYTYQNDTYYQQVQYGYYPEQTYPPPQGEDDTDSLASFVTAPLAGEHEDEPGLIRDEEEADLETLAYYKQKVAEYEEKMEQVEKEKRKLQQELLRLQVVSSMEKNKKTKQLQADTPPLSQPVSKSTPAGAQASKPGIAVNDAPTSPPTAASSPSTGLPPVVTSPTSTASSASAAPPTHAAAMSNSPPYSSAPVSATPWIQAQKSIPKATATNAPVRPAASAPWTQTSSSSTIASILTRPASTQPSAFNFGPSVHNPVASSSNAKLTLSALAQPGTPAPSSPVSTHTRMQQKVPLGAPIEPKPATPTSAPAAVKQANQQAASARKIPTVRSAHRQQANASPSQARKANPPAAASMVPKPSSKGGAFKPYESPLKRYGLANTNTNGPRTGNPEQQMCKYETVGGTCNDDTCQALHFRDFQKNT